MRICFLFMNRGHNIERGAGYVAASIPKDHPLLVLFAHKKLIGLLVKKMLAFKPDILMVSSMTLGWVRAVQIMKAFKIASPGTPVLVGGIHATILKEETLENHVYIDYACVGEGETFIKEFLVKYKTPPFFEIANLVYRNKAGVFLNPVRPPEDLKTLPKFPWDIFPRPLSVGKYKLLYVTASRGCPYSCTYCGNRVYLELYGKSYIRQRPINQVLDELEELADKHEFGEFYFSDDMMFTDIDYVKELFSGIKKRLNKPYGCMGRCEYVDESLANFLQATGCSYVAMGVECGDENFRRKYLKRFMTNDQIITSFKLLQDRGIRTTSFNMIGYPFYFDDDLCRSTIEINKVIDPDILQLSWFYPFRGTQLYDYCVENSLISGKALSSYHAGSILKMHIGKNNSPERYLEKLS